METRPEHKFDVPLVRDARQRAADAQCDYALALKAAIDAALDGAGQDEKDRASAEVHDAENAEKLEDEIYELESILSRLDEDGYDAI
jgi:hypothetical protein